MHLEQVGPLSLLVRAGTGSVLATIAVTLLGDLRFAVLSGTIMVALASAVHAHSLCSFFLATNSLSHLFLKLCG
jgi:NAD(P)H-hydrate repair Nnr-like enzyme with NAD(P)H-hydrate dehydratase domain